MAQWLLAWIALLTHMIADNSPAKDEGGRLPDADQRGIHRPQGNTGDIGAVEWRHNDAFYQLFVAPIRR